MTKKSIIDVYRDKGNLGEFLIYHKLRSFEKAGAKFLFNLYIPKEDNETTEIDVIAICKKGIIVFESKNYSGWIFGDINSKMWMQTLPNGKGKSIKTQFYNPIFQNQTHINNLKKLIDEDIPIFSVITFSERCTLKEVPRSTNEVRIIKRDNVLDTVANIIESNPNIMQPNEIIKLYGKLYKYTQVDETTKQQHIQNIKSKY